ncbi:MAG: prephenate dehydratase [Polyangiales bacterium]
MHDRAVPDDLKKYRDALDAIDQRIVDDLAERQSIVAGVAKLKVDGSAPLRDRAREEAILTKLAERGEAAGLDRYYVVNVFRHVLEHSVRVQQEALVDADNPARQMDRTLSISYQGGEGAYSHIAAMRHFGARGVDVEYRGYASFREMLEAVRSHAADYGILPIENTTAGSINEAYDLLASMDLVLVGEEVQPVDHCLLVLPGTRLDQIRRVLSHPQAIAQCREFLDSLPDAKVEAYIDTALSAEKVKRDGDATQAAIASDEAGRIHGLDVLRRGIQNQPENFTRMVVVARAPLGFDPRIACKTSLIIATKHQEGALLLCLNVLADHGLNLTKLESRPRPNTPWEYLFYVDFEGNIADPRVKDAVERLREHTSYLKVLGTYPAKTLKQNRPADAR